jgi:ribonuclease HI
MSSRAPSSVVVYIDGASRGNPGPSGIGIAVFPYDDQTKSIAEISRYIGITTNNVAEYEALIHALKWLITSNVKYATIKLDSELVYKQLSGKYKVRSPHMAIQIERVERMKVKIEACSFILIPRTENKIANRLAQKAAKKVKINKQSFTQEKLIK